MNLNFVLNSAQYKDYYLIISGINQDRRLHILDKELKLLLEHRFEGIQLYNACFHIDDNSKQLLNSVITTEVFQFIEEK